MATEEENESNPDEVSKTAIFVIFGVIIGGALFMKFVFPIINSHGSINTGLKQAQKEARDARRETGLSQIQTEISLYENENEDYPKSLAELKESSPLIKINDPKTNERFAYATTSGKLKYCLGACLETDDAPLDHSRQCVKKLSLSCREGTPYAVSGE